MNSSIYVEIDNRGVGYITLSEPENHNALSKKMIIELTNAFKEFQRDSSKMVVLKSVGESFSSGADLNYMKKVSEYSLAKNREEAELLANLMQSLYNLRKPTIAIVQGPAFGGAIGLIACCDIAIVAQNASFCFSEVKLGLIPAIISPYVIQAIGVHKAKALFLSALPFDAAKAFEMGLCHEVVEPSELISASEKWLDTLLKNGPQALKAVKKLLNHIAPLKINPELIDLTTEYLVRIRSNDEGQEGISAFLEKRLPSWRGKKK